LIKAKDKFLSKADLILERVIDLTKKYRAAKDQKHLMNNMAVEEKIDHEIK